MRITRVLHGNEWVIVRMQELKKGDKFLITGDELCPTRPCIAACDAFYDGEITHAGSTGWGIEEHGL
jgi:hypothetical protein